MTSVSIFLLIVFGPVNTIVILSKSEESTSLVLLYEILRPVASVGSVSQIALYVAGGLLLDFATFDLPSISLYEIGIGQEG